MNLSYVYLNEEDMVGVTDFELSEYSIRLFDVCYVATGILSENFSKEENATQKWLVLYQSMMRGYDKVAKFTEEEKQMLPYVIWSIQMICVAYFAGKEQFAELAEINERMLMELMKYKCPYQSECRSPDYERRKSGRGTEYDCRFTGAGIAGSGNECKGNPQKNTKRRAYVTGS